MNSDEYIQERLQDQIDWYDRKSLTNQKTFKWLRKVEIIFAAFIPFLSGLMVKYDTHIVVFSTIIGLLGIAVTIFTGMLALGKYQENWIEYRTTCESLKKEKYMFQTKVEPYDVEDAFSILVQRIETLVSKENTNWAQYMMRPEEEKKNGKG